MAEYKHTMADLYQMQALSLKSKIRMTEQRIWEWVDTFGEDGVYVSFSGGKDSTVLLDIIKNRMGLKDVHVVFVDVPTQYPELKQFALSWGDVEVLKPKMSFMRVCEEYGFPMVSKEVAHKMHDWNTSHAKGKMSYVDRQFDGDYKSVNGKSNMVNISKWGILREAPFRVSHMCCNKLKKEPVHEYERKTGRMPITAQMASESMLRANKWLQFGCNAFDAKRKCSNPMSFWTEQDVLLYILENNLPICSVYGDVVYDYGATENIEGQMTISDIAGFENMELFDAKRPPLKTTGCDRTGCMMCGFGCHLEKPGEGRFELLKQTHPKMYALLDVCKNNGVTMREAIEWLNEHGDLNIKL